MSTPPTNQNRVLIVDDHAVVSAGLRMLIEKQPTLAVVGEASNRADAVSLAIETQPNVIILDLDLGRDKGIDMISELLEVTGRKARILILTGVRDPEVHRHAFRLGAMGLVMKERASEELILAIEKVNSGQIFIEQSMLATVLAGTPQPVKEERNPEADKLDSLTQREREIILLICQGLKNREIAKRLFITESTVRFHKTAIFNKLQVSDQIELAIYAYRNNLAESTQDK